MAATHPSGDPYRHDTGFDDVPDRATMSSAPETSTRRSPWLAIAIAVVVIAVIGVLAYIALYSGGSSGGDTGGNGGTEGYVVVAFTGDAARRLVGKFKR